MERAFGPVLGVLRDWHGLVPLAAVDEVFRTLWGATMQGLGVRHRESGRPALLQVAEA